MPNYKLKTLSITVGVLFLSACCNTPKKISDPRTPSGIQTPTLAACEAVKNTTCTFANGNVAQTMGRLMGSCQAYCNTPATENNKSCKPLIRNLNTGTGVCEPEPLTETPSYYHVMCVNLSIDCSCE